MSGRNLSGAQNRKRKKYAEQAANKSSEFFKTFFKKAKSDESESEDDDQLVVHATNKTVEQPQGDTSLQEELYKTQHSFSKLKLILSYLRASMGQDRLSDLALLPGLTFPASDLAPKRNKKFGYCGLNLV